mmetsp:Transcript_71241/g.159494  ORF Transcript_71241/g.159494 Transcript_71241/m.159494 type:complete len:217 (+) Transcript_71241:558-1208(+)
MPERGRPALHRQRQVAGLPGQTEVQAALPVLGQGPGGIEEEGGRPLRPGRKGPWDPDARGPRGEGVGPRGPRPRAHEAQRPPEAPEPAGREGQGPVQGRRDAQAAGRQGQGLLEQRLGRHAGHSQKSADERHEAEERGSPLAQRPRRCHRRPVGGVRMPRGEDQERVHQGEACCWQTRSWKQGRDQRRRRERQRAREEAGDAGRGQELHQVYRGRD